MIDHKEIPLQRLYMMQAIELFQEAYLPYVIDHMRMHFRNTLNAHLRGLSKRDTTPVIVDFANNQPRPDVLALIHLMTSDGGLVSADVETKRVIFSEQADATATHIPVRVPRFDDLHSLRQRRNLLFHQGQLTGDDIVDTIQRITQMVASLPESYQAHERTLQLQLILARAQSSEFEKKLNHLDAQKQAQMNDQRQQALVTKQQEHATQLQQVAEHVASQQHDVVRAQQLLTELQQQLTQMMHDQQILVSGTAEAVIDVRRQFEQRIEELQGIIAVLQGRKSPDTQTLHHFEKVQHELEQHRKALAVQQQLAADMRAELNRLHEQLHTQSAPQKRWQWVVWVVIIALLGWLWYSGWLMWGIGQLQPYIEQFGIPLQ